MYQDVFWGGNFEAINLLQKADLNKKKQHKNITLFQ